MHVILLLLRIQLNGSGTMSHLDRKERIHHLVERGILDEMIVMTSPRLLTLLRRRRRPLMVKRSGVVGGGKGNGSVVMKRMKLAVAEAQGITVIGTKMNTVDDGGVRKWIVPDIGRRRGDDIAVAVIGTVEATEIAVASAATNAMIGGGDTGVVEGEGDRARTVIAAESH